MICRIERLEAELEFLLLSNYRCPPELLRADLQLMGPGGRHPTDAIAIEIDFGGIRDAQPLPSLGDWHSARCSLTNTDHRLAVDPLGPVEGGDGVIEGR